MTVLRRLSAIWCLAAMLCGEAAQAKSLIVTHHINPEIGTTQQEAKLQNNRNVRILKAIIARTGGEFSEVTAENTNVEWVRTGNQVWNMGNTTPAAPSAGAFVEHFPAVIHLGSGNTNPTLSAGSFRVDSLMKPAVQARAQVGDSSVPFLAILDNSAFVYGTTNFTATIDTVTGITEQDNGPGKAIYFANSGEAFNAHAYVAGGIGAGAASNQRKILFGGTPAYVYRSSHSADGVTVPCKTCDSLASYAENDTVVLVDRQYRPMFSKASTVSMVFPFGAGSLNDSLTGGFPYNPPTEGDFAVMLAGLAHLDSLSGGAVLGEKVIKIAPVVYGGLARGERHSWKSPGSAQGILAADTASFYAILDSLSALNIPITFAVNVDSASSYQRDIIKLKSVKLARFTPQVWTGVSDTTAAGAAAGYPVDVFGRYRKRAAYGDSAYHSVVGADSSIYWLAKRSRNMCDSIFGSDRTSAVAVAPDDDWSPKNIEGVSGMPTRVTIDSVVWALKQAGYVGVVADAQDPDANASKRNGGPSQTNPRGYYSGQGTYALQLKGVPDSLENVVLFKVLSHSGYQIMGGRAQTITYADSSGAASEGSPGILWIELSRLWSAALLEFDNSYDTWPYDGSALSRPYDNVHQRKVDRTVSWDTGRPVKRGNIYRLSCADLSGVQPVPAAIGFHVLKSAKIAMDTINRLAGRIVVQFAYPEDIEP